jgi:hypothetical protein
MTNSSYTSKHDAGYSTAQYPPVSGGEARNQSVIEVDETRGEVVGQEAEPETAGAHRPVSHTMSKISPSGKSGR